MKLILLSLFSQASEIEESILDGSLQKVTASPTFSASNLLAGFIFSVIGLWLFREGRRRTNISITIIGLILMLYSIFTPTPLATWMTGLTLCALAYHFWS